MLPLELSSRATPEFNPRRVADDPRHVCCYVMGGRACVGRAETNCIALDQVTIADLKALAHFTVFDPRSVMQHQDAPSNELFVITAGVVSLSKLLPDGRRQVLGFAVPGDFIGLTPSDRNLSTAKALTRVIVCQFNRLQFQNLAYERPALLRRLYELTSRELVAAHEHMVALGHLTAEERIACFLLALRVELANIYGLSDEILLPMSRQDIADYLGLTIETVSRMFTRFEREGVLNVSASRVEVLDFARLEALAAK